METEFSILFQMGGCRCGAVRFVWGGKFLLNDFRGETQTLLLILLVGLYFVCRGLGGWKVSQRLLLPLFYCSPGSIEAIWGFYRYTVGLINTIAYTA